MRRRRSPAAGDEARVQNCLRLPQGGIRRRAFLGLPLSWTPTTWVFNREGTLAYAFNYGEVSNEMLALAIEHARDEWMHE